MKSLLALTKLRLDFMSKEEINNNKREYNTLLKEVETDLNILEIIRKQAKIKPVDFYGGGGYLTIYIPDNKTFNQVKKRLIKEGK